MRASDESRRPPQSTTNWRCFAYFWMRTSLVLPGRLFQPRVDVSVVGDGDVRRGGSRRPGGRPNAGSSACEVSATPELTSPSASLHVARRRRRQRPRQRYVSVSVSAASGTSDQVVLAGFISYDDDGYIDLMFTAPHRTRAGVASALYLEVESRLSAMGVCELFTKASLVARPFFERQGFTIEAEESMERRGVVLRGYRMRKRIAGSLVTG